MNDNNLIREIGRSFIVSSFVPAALFTTLATLIFRDFTPYFVSKRIIPNDSLYAGQWFLILLFVFWMGFGLYSGWNWTVKLFEGYYLPSLIANLMKERLYREKENQSTRILEYLAIKHKPGILTEDETRRMTNLFYKALEDYQPVELYYPMEKEDFLPTRLGNILRASEIYSWDRYRMEGITMFSRLVHLFPPTFANQLEEQNNKFIFLLNSALLSLLLGGLAILVAVIRVPCYVFHFNVMKSLIPFYSGFICPSGSYPTNFFQSGFQTVTEGKYFLIGLIFIVSGYFLYRVSIIAASAYSRLIRTGFDLYRFDLLKKLSFEQPESFSEEQSLWTDISQLLISAERLGTFTRDYEKQKKSFNG